MSGNQEHRHLDVSGAKGGRFATTRWSMVAAAGRRSSPDADQALEFLCEAYWYPLYAFARRRGATATDAADLTQEFFVRLLDHEFLRTANPELGRFRSFLLTIFKRFLAQQHQRDHAEKRGGYRTRLSLDFEDGERRYRIEPVDNWSPEKLFERRWALTLLSRVLDRLRQEYVDHDKARLFDSCRQWLSGDGSGGSPNQDAGSNDYAAVATELSMSEGAVRVAVHRMRERYRLLLRAEVAETVDGSDAVDDELRRLKNSIRGGT